MKTRSALLAFAALTAASLACNIGPGIPRINTGPTQTLAVSEPLPTGVEVVSMEIDMAAGELNVSSGATGVVEGEIRYNVTEWAPQISNTGDAVKLSQSDNDGVSGLPDDRVINDWTLRLGEIPYDLTINAGAYSGSLDLDGVPLRGLTVHDGASEAEVEFNSLNPEIMAELRYETGASSVTLIGLANANAEEIVFTSGAGDYELDFTGDLQRDLDVTINSGVSSLRIVVPAGTKVQINVDGALTDVEANGGWAQSGDSYSLAGSGPTITIDVDMGVGSLTLVEQ